MAIKKPGGIISRCGRPSDERKQSSEIDSSAIRADTPDYCNTTVGNRNELVGISGVRQCSYVMSSGFFLRHEPRNMSGFGLYIPLLRVDAVWVGTTSRWKSRLREREPDYGTGGVAAVWRDLRAVDGTKRFFSVSPHGHIAHDHPGFTNPARRGHEQRNERSSRSIFFEKNRLNIEQSVRNKL